MMVTKQGTRKQASNQTDRTKNALKNFNVTLKDVSVIGACFWGLGVGVGLLIAILIAAHSGY
jgi:predicted benzoate:H+ symporter BenE